MVINPTAGVYIPITRIPIKGGMTIPNIATFHHGTYVDIQKKGEFPKLNGALCERGIPIVLSFVNFFVVHLVPGPL